MKNHDQTMSLFAYNGRPGFQRHSRTSRKAADEGGAAFSRQAKLVLDFIERQGRTGATTDEVRKALLAEGKIHQNSVMSARVRELELAGRIIKTAEERKTSAGQGANVYVTKEIFDLGGFLRDCAKPADDKPKKVGMKEIEAFMATVATCQLSNTHEWMEYMAERANEMLAAAGSKKRVSVSRRGNLSMDG